MTSISARFGSRRGAVRLALSYLEVLAGRGGGARGTPPFERLVFVCQGNICRSAFAEALARRHGLEVASFGLATSTGMPADPAAQRAAAHFGIDLSAHRTTARADFVARPGDLLLAMEVRQLRRLAADPGLAALPRSLLGLWSRPPAPHLHDPFQLSEGYFLSCFNRIDRAVARLAASRR